MSCLFKKNRKKEKTVSGLRGKMCSVQGGQAPTGQDGAGKVIWPDLVCSTEGTGWPRTWLSESPLGVLQERAAVRSCSGGQRIFCQGAQVSPSCPAACGGRCPRSCPWQRLSPPVSDGGSGSRTITGEMSFFGFVRPGVCFVFVLKSREVKL